MVGFRHMLMLFCFGGLPVSGILAGKPGGIPWMFVGLIVGSATGFAAHKTLDLTYRFLEKHYKEDAHAEAVKALVGLGVCIWIGIILLSAVALSIHLTQIGFRGNAA